MAIKWKDKIQNNEEFIDLQGLPYYTIKFDEKSKIKKVYEYDIVIPSEPKDEDCVNYGLPIHDQIFRKTYIPKQILSPNTRSGRDSLLKEDVDAFVDAEWNRRRNGIWFWIKGEKTYIPPLLYMKMNYWKSITGQKFIYKFSDWEFFIFWQMCTYDPVCDGMADFKCRQIGDTENVVLIMWEYGSRVRGTINALQSCINEGHAKKTYYRLVYGHKKMIYYFRPINQGTEDPKKGLNLSYPAQHITFTSIKEKNKSGEMANKSSLEDYEYPEIGSQFYFGPSNESEFDGTTLGRAYCDEFGKSKKMNPVEWIKVIKEATENRILNKKMGMILMTSTVEDFGGDSLQWAKDIWKQSDPTKRSPNGKTANGLYRIFRNVIDRGDVDRWGFPMREQILEKINNQIKMFMDAGDIKGAISFRRKNCITIEDVFTGANDNSQFDIEKLTKRHHYIHNEAPKQLWVRGNLKWKDNIRDTEVIWEPNSKGRWLISKHPSDFGLESNKKVAGVFSPKPGNDNYFCCGIDPFDQKSTMESADKRSKGGIAVKRRLDQFIDGSEDNYYQFDDNNRGIRIGDPVDDGKNFQTNRYVCTYLERPEDPAEFYEDVILTVTYYGTDYLPEKNKSGGLQTYVEGRGYGLYLMERPNFTRNGKGNSERDGVTANEGTIDTYFGFLTTLSAKWSNTIDHPDLLEQLLSMNWDNRGTKDLGVAAGWCEYAASIPKMKFKPREQAKIKHWEENYV